MPQVYFIDVTNRDVVQAARVSLSKFQKTMLNLYLAEFGVHQSEFGFPCLRHEQNYIEGNLDLQRLGAMGQMVLEGWCRAIVEDVEKAVLTGVRDLNLSISTSDHMIRHKFRGKLDRASVIKETVESINCARAHKIRTVGANAEDASRTDLGYLIEFAQAAKEAGADRVRYCDTLGCDSPTVIYDRIRELAEKVGVAIELHCHSDLGMANANSLAGARGAIDGGVDAYINATVNGLGERAGQADLLSCVLALKHAAGLRDAMVLGDDIKLEMAWKLANYVSYAFGIPLPINQPGVGANAFAHESGIHADGVLKDRENYELYDYELLGRGAEERVPTGRVITTGEYGGLAGFKHVYSRLGVEWTDHREATKILELVQYANAHNQKPLVDEELLLIARHPEQIRKVLTMTP